MKQKTGPSARGSAFILAGAQEGREARRVYLPWPQALRMCWASVRNRKGRFLLVFLGIAVVVAFLMLSYSGDLILTALSRSDDVHTQAILERAGVFARDAAAAAERADRARWIMVLSCVLCFFGITNTILMSVNERVGEIGTLKCLGALDRFVVRLVLMESAFIGLLASVAGAVAGYVLTILQVVWMLEASVLSLRLCLAPLVVGMPLAVAAGTALTLLAAAYPTAVAARMAPAEAMRKEF